MSTKKQQSGFLLVQTFVFATVSIMIVGALISWAAVNIKASRLAVEREQALQIAEAGIDYYRWHLAHAANDYTDGGSATSTGPFVHNFLDKDGNVIGTFSLTITPPQSGFTLVKIKSTGTLASDPTVSRSIAVQFATPSLAQYAVVANDNMRFGQGTEVFGAVQANGGIRFDGLAHNLVSSAKSTYTDPSHSGGVEFGVHTHVNFPATTPITNDNFRPLEAPPNPVASRPDVFEVGRQFPVPAIDFTGFTVDLSQIKAKAQAGGKYLSSSGALGYHIVFKTNGTYDLYKVTSLQAAPGSCTNDIAQTGWGTWSIKSSGGQTFVANYSNPANGLIFVEDNVWVDGQINTARVTVAAGRFPDSASTRPSITFNSNLTYTNYDGRDVISLMSQGNINAGLFSANDLRVDAALIAQNGRVGRYHYASNCGSNYIRNSITLYGTIATNLQYGFAYTDGTGYQARNIIYDANLLYGPPPSYPLTSSQYQILSWEEVQ